jgi:hypothetical protein
VHTCCTNLTPEAPAACVAWRRIMTSDTGGQNAGINTCREFPSLGLGVCYEGSNMLGASFLHALVVEVSHHDEASLY